MTTRAASATSRSDASSLTSACSSGTSTPRRSASASSLALLRPARAQRSPSPACAARYSAVSAPVNPVAPKRTMSCSRSAMAEHSMSAAVLGSLVAVLARLGLSARLGPERPGHEARDERPDRALGNARVDAGLARSPAAVAEARRADEAQRAVERLREQRPAGVALAGVGPALRIAGAQHGLRVERSAAQAVGVRGRAVGVGPDRDARLLHRVRRLRRVLGGKAEAGDRREPARVPD